MINTYGYVRVSSADQNADRQLVALCAAGVLSERVVKFGRPHRYLPDDFAAYVQSVKAGELSIRQAAKRCSLPETTFRRLAQLRKDQEPTLFVNVSHHSNVL